MVNGISMEYLWKLGKYEQTKKELEAKEIRRITVAYDVLSSHITEQKWKELDERKFWLTYALYPKKKMLELE